MKLKKFFLVFFIFPLWVQAEEIPVLLFLSTYDQDDSLGFNLVQSLPEFVYDKIIEGKVTLWDSPKKEDKIGPQTLIQIEKYEQTSFKVTNQLFIYEKWQKDRKRLNIETIGFYFSSKKSDGAEVAYGFVEYAELDSAFRVTLVPANADGNCSMTYDDALKRKLYNYNIVQYGGKRIESVAEAIKVKNEIQPLLPSRSWNEKEDCKMVQYIIEDSAAAKVPAVVSSRKFLSAFSKYLTETPELFLNIGGDKLTMDPAKFRIVVNKIEMVEYWIMKDSAIDYSIYSMVVYVNNTPLNALSLDEIQQLDFLVGFRSVNDFLKEKEFYFRILKINSQEIPAEKSAAYWSGIKELRWSQLIEWAKYQ